MLNLPNAVSFIRLPMALLFLQANVFVRTLAIVIAMITDGLDGYLARRFRLASVFGTLFDPLMDRFFVTFTLAVFFTEGRIELWQAATLFCRDLAVMFFGFYLVFTGKISKYNVRAFFCGKATTFFQFLLLIILTLGVEVPSSAYLIFVTLGMMAMIELAFFFKIRTT